MPLIALVFLCNGKRTGLAIHTEELHPDVWGKLSGNLHKQHLNGGGTVHVASKASWSYFVTMCGVTYRGKHAGRQLTGKPLSVNEPTIEALLAAIDSDEQERLKVPVELEPWNRRTDLDPNLHNNPLCTA